eukprot:Pgem_evm1s6793
MNSYDVFDTLIGRLTFKGQEIFSILESEFKLANFATIRHQSERVCYNFDGLYQIIKIKYCLDEVTLEQIKSRELELEKILSFPILLFDSVLKEGTDKVVLISDVYLPHQTVNELIQQHDPTTPYELIVTYDGKSSKRIWQSDLCQSFINQHLGDNRLSDYQYPIEQNIKAALVYTGRQLIRTSLAPLESEMSTTHDKGSLFIDLQGTGATFSKLVDQSSTFTMKNYLLLFTNNYRVPNLQYVFCHPFESENQYHTELETLFSAPHGSVSALDATSRTYQFNPAENNVELFQQFFTQLKTFRQYYRTMVDIFPDMNSAILLLDDMTELTKFIITDSIYDVTQHFVHNSTHDTSSNDNNKKEIWYSQIEQDSYFVQQISKYQPNGTFVEIGGYDGVTGSNTYYMEKNLNWTGLVVEPNPEAYKKCVQSRPRSVVIDKAIYEYDHSEIEFRIPVGREIEGGQGQLSAMVDHIRPDNLWKFKDSYDQSNVITVKTVNINTLLKNTGLKHIDYLSLDVEGYELDILKQWDFCRFPVDFLTVEHGNEVQYQQQIETYMKTQQYTLHRHNKWDDEYIFSPKNYLTSLREKCWSYYDPQVTPYIHGWFDLCNKLILQEVLKTNPKVFVELGVWYGKSSSFILENSNCTLISVDIWNQDASWYTEANVIDMVQKHPLHPTFLANFYKYKDRLIPIKNNDITTLKELYQNQVQIDAIYLDTTHYYQDTIDEITTILTLFPNVVLCGDDYIHSGVHGGCGVAIDEMAHKFNKK